MRAILLASLLVAGLARAGTIPGPPAANDGEPRLSFAVGDSSLSFRDGLPAEQVLSLFQEKSGTLWAGTVRGLVRLGAPEPEIFGLADGLPSVVVSALGASPSGRLLAGTPAGLAEFDGVRFHPVELPGERASGVVSIAGGGDATYILAREGRLFGIRASGVAQNLRLPPGTWFRSRSIAVDASGKLWVATREDGLLALKVDAAAAALTLERRVTSGNGVNGAFSFVARDGDGVAATGSTGLVLVSGDSVARIDYPRGYPDSYHSLTRSPDGRLFVGSSEGVAEVDRAAGVLRPLASLRKLAAAPSVRVLCDHDGNLWSGTVNQGLVLLRTGNGVRFLLAGDDLVRQLHPLDSGLRLALTDRDILSFRLGTDGTLRGVRHVESEGRAPSRLNRVAERAGGPLVATEAGVWRLVSGPGDAVRLVDDPSFDALHNEVVLFVHVDAAGEAFATARGRLYRLGRGAAAASPMELPSGVSRIISAAADAADGLWIRTEDSTRLLYLTPPPERRLRMLKLTGAPAPISFLGASPSGILLLSFEDGSTWQLRGEEPFLVAAIPASSPLGGLAALSLARRPDGTLLGAVGGRLFTALELAPPRRLEPLVEAADLDGTDLGYASVYPEAGGRFWLTTLGRAALWIPRPASALSSLEVLVGGVRPRGPVRLPPRPNRLELRLELPDPANPAAARYRYRLADEESVFSEWTPSTRLTLSGLARGLHVLEVEAKDGYGRAAQPSVRVEIVVEPRLTERTAFHLAVAAGILFLVYGSYRLRVGLLLRTQERLQEAVTARTQELHVANERLAAASLTDSVTGLRNRRYVEETVGTLLSAARRRESLAVLIADLDHFKRVNDSFGHAEGDEVLRRVAAALLAAVRGETTISRWGGEEFVILSRVATTEEALSVAERIRTTVAASVSAGEGAKRRDVTVSVGFALFPASRKNADLLDFDATLALADAALYRAKRAGRNRCAGVAGIEDAIDRAVDRDGRDAVQLRFANLDRAEAAGLVAPVG